MRTATSLFSVAVAVLVMLQTASAWSTPSFRLPLVDDALNMASRLTQADERLKMLTAEQNAALAATEERVDDIVESVHAKGPSFETCSLALVKANEDAFEAAYTGIYACNETASSAIRTLALSAVDSQLGTLKGCSLFDVTCVLGAITHRKSSVTTREAILLNGNLENLLEEARRCMALAANGVHDVTSELSVDVLECDAETSKVAVIQPQKSWIKKNKKKVINAGISTCVRFCYALVG